MDNYKIFFEELNSKLEHIINEININNIFKKLKDKYNIEIINIKTLEVITDLNKINDMEKEYCNKNNINNCLIIETDEKDYYKIDRCRNRDCNACELEALIKVGVLKIINKRR